MTAPLLLTIDEAARLLSVSKRTAETLIARGNLASVRVGRCRRVARVAVESFVAELVEDQAIGEVETVGINVVHLGRGKKKTAAGSATATVRESGRDTAPT